MIERLDRQYEDFYKGKEKIEKLNGEGMAQLMNYYIGNTKNDIFDRVTTEVRSKLHESRKEFYNMRRDIKTAMERNKENDMKLELIIDSSDTREFDLNWAISTYKQIYKGRANPVLKSEALARISKKKEEFLKSCFIKWGKGGDSIKNEVSAHLEEIKLLQIEITPDSMSRLMDLLK